MADDGLDVDGGGIGGDIAQILAHLADTLEQIIERLPHLAFKDGMAVGDVHHGLIDGVADRLGGLAHIGEGEVEEVTRVDAAGFLSRAAVLLKGEGIVLGTLAGDGVHDIRGLVTGAAQLHLVIPEEGVKAAAQTFHVIVKTVGNGVGDGVQDLVVIAAGLNKGGHGLGGLCPGEVGLDNDGHHEQHQDDDGGGTEGKEQEGH